MLLKKREKGAEDSCDINLVGPRQPPTSPIFDIIEFKKIRKGVQRSPNFKKRKKKQLYLSY